MNKQKGNQSRKKANYYTRQFERTTANKARRALKAKRKRPLKPEGAARLLKLHLKKRDERTARRTAERAAKAALEKRREKELAELRESIKVTV